MANKLAHASLFIPPLIRLKKIRIVLFIWRREYNWSNYQFKHGCLLSLWSSHHRTVVHRGFRDRTIEPWSWRLVDDRCRRTVQTGKLNCVRGWLEQHTDRCHCMCRSEASRHKSTRMHSVWSNGRARVLVMDMATSASRSCGKNRRESRWTGCYGGYAL